MFDTLSLDTTLVEKLLCIVAATSLAQSEEEDEGYSRFAYDLVDYGAENRRQVKLGVSKAFLHLQRKVSLRWTNQQPSSFSFAALQWRCIPPADLANSKARDVWPDFAP